MTGRAVDFVMPSLGADMDEGTITEWLVAVGDRVARGDVVAIVETDKADIDVEVWNDGEVTEILVEPGRLVPVGTPLARLDVGDRAPGARDNGAGSENGTGGEPPSAATPEGGPAPTGTTTPDPGSDRAPAPAPVGAPAVALVGHGRRPPSSPLARCLAADRGIDLAAVTGTGPGGAVVARDLEAIDAAAATAAPPRDAAPDRMRRAIAELMSRANREIPHYHLATELDVEPALVWLESINADRPVDQRILPAAVLLRAVALGLAANPDLNGFWIDDRFVPGDGIHLGVAIALRGGGLVAPAIRHADRLDLDESMAALGDLVARARAGRLRGSEMTAPTVTVTNLGDRGVEVVHGVIHPPQVALIGFGRIVRRPAVVDDEVVPRRLVVATLAADHRASDGQRGSRLLTDLQRRLSRPEELR